MKYARSCFIYPYRVRVMSRVARVSQWYLMRTIIIFVYVTKLENKIILYIIMIVTYTILL